jgi:flavin reductase (DIM6/NTAB) family NADH-FMN oxidoreductase RutF
VPTGDAVTPGTIPGSDDAVAADEAFLDADRFKAVFRHHPAGVAVITVRTPAGELVGLTATSVISVSAAPPILAFSIASSSSSWPALARARTVAVSFLADDQDDVSARFATRDTDRFAAGGWSLLDTGEPVIDGAVAWVRGAIMRRTPAGDSYLVSVLALSSSSRTGANAIVYHDRTYHRIGAHTAI